MVLAEGIESANVVGYQDFGGTVDSLISTAPTFKAIGDQATLTLADITVNDAGLDGGVSVRFFGANGDPLEENDYIYVNATAYGGEIDGWYTADVFDTFEFPAEACRNSKVIADGTGFVVIPSVDGAIVKYAGEVKQDVKDITGETDALIRVGNATPVDITLADITVNDAGLDGGVSVRFFGANGDPLEENDYIYVNATAYGGEIDGWYTADVFDTFEFPAEACRNSTPVPAGAGFVLIPSVEGAKITLPSPMGDK